MDLIPNLKVNVLILFLLFLLKTTINFHAFYSLLSFIIEVIMCLQEISIGTTIPYSCVWGWV